MYIYRQMLYSVDCAQILYSCNESCGSAENIAVMVMKMMIMTMMSRRRRGEEI